jgi:INO80 complex subunit C
MSRIINPNAEEIARQQAAHAALVQQLDINHVSKPFRAPTWRPNQRRNKNIKTILGDASRKEASASQIPTQDNSGVATPLTQDDESSTTTQGDNTPMDGADGPKAPNLAQASKSLSKLVLERNMAANAQANAGRTPGTGPGATYMNIESAPTLAPTKHYCDITGLPAPYTDPKTRLRYHNKEIFGVVRTLGQGVAEQYLEARGAHTILK